MNRWVPLAPRRCPVTFCPRQAQPIIDGVYWACQELRKDSVAGVFSDQGYTSRAFWGAIHRIGDFGSPAVDMTEEAVWHAESAQFGRASVLIPQATRVGAYSMYAQSICDVVGRCGRLGGTYTFS